MIARAETADLALPTVFRPLGDELAVCVGATALILAVLHVLTGCIPCFDRPIEPAVKHLGDGVDVGLDDAAVPDPGRDVGKQCVDEFLLSPADVVVRKIRPDHSHATVDIEADRTGGDTALLGVDRTNAADREPVPLVAVGHTECVGCHPR